ncbi:MAG: ABC transporter substrate-binding protein [Anaerovoracaceae bacterium]
MKKKFMKFAVVAMSVMMAFTMAGCGGGSSSDASENSIKIGGIGPTTGPAAVYGNAVKNGAQLAVDEINAAGGEAGIELNFQDDENDAEKAVNAYNELKDWGMQMLLGTVTTNPCISVSAETNNDRIFELTPSASSADVTKGKDNVFQLCFTDPNQGFTAADIIMEKKLGTKIAAIYNNADAYSTGIYNAFKSEVESKGGEIVYSGTFASDDNADFSAQLNGAKNAGADLVFLPIYYTPASLILQQADSMGYEPTFFGCDGMDGILSLEGFDTALAENVMLMTPFNPWSEDESVSGFVSAYEEAYDETPNQFAADAYDCVYAMYNAFTNAGLSVEDANDAICDAMVGQFTGDFSHDGLTGSGMKWNDKGEVSKTPVVCVIKDGKYVDVK